VIYYGQLGEVVGDLNPAAGIPERPKRTPEPSDYNNRQRGVSNRQSPEIGRQSPVLLKVLVSGHGFSRAVANIQEAALAAGNTGD
jgi:hypothetical protein